MNTRYPHNQLHSLERRLKGAKTLKTKNKLLNELWEVAIYFDPKRAMRYSTAAVDTASSTSDQYQAKLHRAINLLVIDRYEEALGEFNEVIAILDHGADPVALARAYYYAGCVHTRMGEEWQALKYFQEALASLLAEGRESELYLHITFELASACKNLGYLQSALEYYARCIAGWKERKHVANEAIVLANLGEVYAELSDAETAVTHFTQARQILECITTQETALSVFQALVKACKGLKDYEAALAYTSALQLNYHHQQRRYNEAEALYELGMFYAERKQFSEAEHHLNESKLLAQTIGSTPLALRCTLSQAKLCSERSDLRSAKALLLSVQSIAVQKSQHKLEMEATEELAKLCFVSGDHEEAFEYLQLLSKLVRAYYTTELFDFAKASRQRMFETAWDHHSSQVRINELNTRNTALLKQITNVQEVSNHQEHEN